MNDIERYFKILGLNIGATAQEAKEAYTDLVKVWHPDRFANEPKLSAKAQDKMKEINEAYRIIKDFFENPSEYQYASESAQKEPDPEKSSQGSPKQSPDMEDKRNTGSKEFNFVEKLKARGPLCWTLMTLGGMIGQIMAKKMLFTKPAEAFWISSGVVTALGALGYFAGSFLIKEINKLPKPKQIKTKLAWGAGIGGVILYLFASGLINYYIPKPDLKSVQPKTLLDFEDPFKKSDVKPVYDSSTEADKKEWVRRGNHYFSDGAFKEAIGACMEAVRLDPDYKLGHDCLGIAYYNLDLYREAIEASKQGIRLNPNDARIHSLLGSCYFNLGMNREAVEAYEQAIRLKPDDVIIHASLCLAYLKLNDRTSALWEFNIVKSLDPERAKRLLDLYSEEFQR